MWSLPTASLSTEVTSWNWNQQLRSKSMNRYPTHSVCDHCSDCTGWLGFKHQVTYLLTCVSSCSHFFISLSLSLSLSPWYNHTGWLGVKHQFTYLLTYSHSLSLPTSLSLPPSLPSSLCLSISLSLSLPVSLSLSLSRSLSLSLFSRVFIFTSAYFSSTCLWTGSIVRPNWDIWSKCHDEWQAVWVINVYKRPLILLLKSVETQQTSHLRPCTLLPP